MDIEVDSAEEGFGECTLVPKPSPDGLRGIGIGIAIVGERGGDDVAEGRNRPPPLRVGDGDAGRLGANAFVVGVFGVDEGRGPGSTERVGKERKSWASRRVSRVGVVSLSFSFSRPLRLLFPLTPTLVPALPPVCIESTISHPAPPSPSSSSSMLGKVCENSVR